MKKRILSLVLCAAMLLSMCLFLGAGVMDDTTADGSAETTEPVDGVNIVSFTNAGPLVTPEQNVGPARVRALAANDTGSGVKLDKTVTGPDDAGNYTVRLEAYATGEQTTTVSTKPCDIVLVLDVSGSMKWCIEGGENCRGNHYTATYSVDPNKYDYSKGITYYIKDASGNYQPLTWCDGQHGRRDHCAGGEGWYPSRDKNEHTAAKKLTPKTSADSDGTQFYEKVGCTSRLSALKTAVGNFIDQVAAKEAADGVKHQISIVKFAGETTKEVGNDMYDETTGIWPFEETNTYNYSQIVKGLTDAKSGQTELKDAVNALSAGGATRADFGMKHAQTVLKNARSNATKVVVMFTDGEPTSGSEFESPVANAAISAAKELKASGATVYTVGCMNGADASRVDDISKLSNTDVNKYMHLVSSNYKNATSMSEPGDATYPTDTSKSYYLTAKNADDLKNVFESISQQVGGAGNTKLTRESKLKDAVTPYFEIPAGAEVTLKTANCTGVNSDGTLKFINEKEITDGSVTATVSRETNTVSVTGFDYSANWCGPRTDAAGNTTYRGQKLIVEFQIKPTADFLGGNGVKTNVGTTDGIYAPGGTTPVEKFQPQQVDVPVKAVNPEATDHEIYLGEKTDLADRVITNIPQLDRVNNAYVDVTYTVKDENGTVVGTYTVLAGKTSSEGTWAWMNGSEVQPDKTTTYTVTSTSTPENLDGTQKAVSSNPVEFKITVKTCSLKITKTVTGGGDPNQTFVFNVMKDGKLVTTVVLKGNKSTTITGLAVGDYTVVEDTNWSWSYKAAENSEKVDVNLSGTKPNGEAKITNTAKENHWLTSIVDVINKWTAKDGKTTINNSDRVPGAN